MTSAELFRRHPANPLLTAADWPHERERRLQPGGGRARRRDGPARPRRGAHGHLAPARSPARQGRRRRLADRPRTAPRAATTGTTASAGASRTRARSGSRSSTRTSSRAPRTGPAGPAVFLATSADFRTVERLGIVVAPEDKNAALLPERIGGTVDPLPPSDVELRRTSNPGISLSRSSDLRSWSTPEVVMEPRDRRLVGRAANRDRAAAPQDRARLAARSTTASRRRSAARSTASGSRCSISRSRHACSGERTNWVLAPASSYERQGDVPNAIFPCGLIHDTRTRRAAPVLRRRGHERSASHSRRSTRRSRPCWRRRLRGEGCGTRADRVAHATARLRPVGARRRPDRCRPPRSAAST